jgi:hypothetical protein
MRTPTVIEAPLRLEPVAGDTLIDDLEPRRRPLPRWRRISAARRGLYAFDDTRRVGKEVRR